MPKANGTVSMLMELVLAASTHKLSRNQSWSALVTVTSAISREVNCQTITSRPTAAPIGNIRPAQAGIRYSNMPVSMAIMTRLVNSMPGTHSACSTENITTHRFIARKRNASQPSDGRKNLAMANRLSAVTSVLSRSRTAPGPANRLTVTLLSPVR